MTQGSTQKGRLEAILDDFTDVHATVLLGMHKELQTLKSDVDERVRVPLESALKNIDEARLEFNQRILQSKELSAVVAARSEGGLRSIDAARLKALEEISSARTAQLADLSALLGEIVQAGTGLKETLQTASDRALEALAAARTSGLAEFKTLLGQIEQSRSALQSENSNAERRMTSFQGEWQTKISASLSYANKMNQESQKLLKKIRDRQSLLYRREVQLQQRTRRLTVGAALAVLVTLGFWLWIALNH